MIATVPWTEEYRRGYLALTKVDDDKPILIHIDSVSWVSFEFDGGKPSTVTIGHGTGAEFAETMVYEQLDELLPLMTQASDEEDAF